MWKFHVFSVTQILREIDLEGCKSSKNAIFAIFRAVNCAILENFSIQKMQKFMKNQNSEPLNVFKWQILHL